MRYKGLWYNPDKPKPERIEHDNTIFIFSSVFSSFRAFVIIKFFHKMTLTAKKRSGQEIRIALPAKSLPTRRHPESFLPDKSTCFRFHFDFTGTGRSFAGWSEKRAFLPAFHRALTWLPQWSCLNIFLRARQLWC